MKTLWGEKLDEKAVLQEYPRPQMRRDSYLNLNGRWEYAIAPGGKGEGGTEPGDMAMRDMAPGDIAPEIYDGTILVPFSPEAVLSGVGRTVQPGDTLWYRRELHLPVGFRPAQSRVLLHFGAVDQEAVVYVNGTEVVRHMGGYTAFSADITEALEKRSIPMDSGDGPLGAAESHTLVVRVKDDTDASYHSRGKQKTQRGGIWYTPQSGIWQTVWLEAVPARYIKGLKMLPSLAEKQLEITVLAEGEGLCAVTIGDATFEVPANRPTSLPIAKPKPWSPEAPYLYDLTVTLEADRVESYFALRDTQVRPDEKGVKRLFLNGKPYFHNGLLDQGYWPDGLYTPPSDEAMIYDIKAAKDMGFNMLRKHIKVEPMRWYYHCDRLGMLVWQDMVNGGGAYRFPTISFPLITGIHHKDTNYRAFARESEAGRAEYMREMEETVAQLLSVPSIVLWVPFNEGWGQFDAVKVCEKLQGLDKSRPIDPASGWHDQKNGELRSYHVYFKPYRFRRDKGGRAVALSEFGGYNLKVEGHTWNDTDYGYKRFGDAHSLQAAYEKLYSQQVIPAIAKGLCAAVYTQLTDVEDELNGLLTYDRRVQKLPQEFLRRLNIAAVMSDHS